MQPPLVRSAADTERHRALQTVVLGFAADPLVRWLLSNADDYLDTAYPFFDAFGGGAVAAGSAYATADFEGAALWLPPGIEPETATIQSLLGAAIAPERLDEALQVFGEMGDYHPVDPIWYLPLIAVDPAHQGRGLGSALMRHALTKCDETQTPAYLESSTPRTSPYMSAMGSKSSAVSRLAHRQRCTRCSANPENSSLSPWYLPQAATEPQPPPRTLRRLSRAFLHR